MNTSLLHTCDVSSAGSETPQEFRTLASVLHVHPVEDAKIIHQLQHGELVNQSSFLIKHHNVKDLHIQVYV